MLWYAPRRKGSVWARTNRERVERLEAAGRMTPAGRAAVERAQADGSWTKTSESSGVQPLGQGTVNTTRTISWYGTATGRVGVAWDNVLLYAKPGIAGMNARYTSEIQEPFVNKRPRVSDRRI